MIKNTKQVNISSMTPDEVKKLQEGIKQMDNALTRVLGEREYVKNSIDALSGEFGIDKKLLRKIVKTYHKASFNFDQDEQKVFEDSYSLLFPKP